MERILIVEDDRDYADFLKSRLDNENYEVDVVYNSIEGIEKLAVNRYDMLISDLHLEKIGGVRVADTAKKIRPEMKTIILTAKPTEDSELESLHYNVDLYLEKSKSLKLILRYVRTLMDSKVLSNERVDYLYSEAEGIVIDNKNRTVMKHEKDYILTPIEYALLELFLKKKEKLLSREDIIAEIWGEESTEDEVRKVDVHIKNLRTKMAIFSIVTVRGSGYKWNEKE